MVWTCGLSRPVWWGEQSAPGPGSRASQTWSRYPADTVERRVRRSLRFPNPAGGACLLERLRAGYLLNLRLYPVLLLNVEVWECRNASYLWATSRLAA